jgi:hypothetical protein
MKNLYRLAPIMAFVFFTSFANADVPTSLHEHAGQMMLSGKIAVFRLQIHGLQFGAPNDRLNSDALVVLDGKPDFVFGVPADEPLAHEMIETLRSAYLSNTPVTIEAPNEPGRKNVRIIAVQLEKK